MSVRRYANGASKPHFLNAMLKRDKKAGAVWTAEGRPKGKRHEGAHHFSMAHKQMSGKQLASACRPSMVGGWRFV